MVGKELKGINQITCSKPYSWEQVIIRTNYEASDPFLFTNLSHYLTICHYFSPKDFFLFLILFQLRFCITDITYNLVSQRDFLTPAIITKSSNFFIAPFYINVFKT